MPLPHPAPLRTCSVDLTLDLSAPRTSRTLVDLLLRQWSVTDPAALDDAAIVVSELVTHVLVHSDDGGPITVGLDYADTLIRFWVLDRCARPAVPRQTRTESPPGMPVVEQLASRWGVQRWPEGRCLYAELPLGPSVRAGNGAERELEIDVR